VTPRHKGKLMTIIPENPETLLDRRETAAALTAKGFPITRGTLSYFASGAGAQERGPAYRQFGRRALYRWADALAWAEGRMREPRRGAWHVVDVQQSAA